MKHLQTEIKEYSESRNYIAQRIISRIEVIDQKAERVQKLIEIPKIKHLL